MDNPEFNPLVLWHQTCPFSRAVITSAPTGKGITVRVNHHRIGRLCLMGLAGVVIAFSAEALVLAQAKVGGQSGAKAGGQPGAKAGGQKKAPEGPGKKRGGEKQQPDIGNNLDEPPANAATQQLRSTVQQTLKGLKALQSDLRDFANDPNGQASQRAGRIGVNLQRLQETLSGLQNASPTTREAILSSARRTVDSLVDDLDGLADEVDDSDLRRLLRLGRQLRNVDRNVSSLGADGLVGAGGSGSGRSSGGGSGGSGGGGTSGSGGIGGAGEQVEPAVRAPGSGTGEKKERPHTLVKDLLAKGLGTADALRDDLRKLLMERPRMREFLEEAQKELDQIRDDLSRLRNAPLNNIAEVTEKTRLTAARLKDTIDKLAESADGPTKQTLNRISTGLARLESELDALAQATMAKAK
jgi:hypothetical protein